MIITMSPELQSLLSGIKQRLMKADISSFKIGKTNNPKERFNQYDEPYHYMDIIAQGDANKINTAEKDLIDWVNSHESLSAKCANINEGGGGNPDATMLYIVSRKAEAEIGEHLLPPSRLFNGDIINL